MKNPFMLRSTHEAEVAALEKELNRLNGLRKVDESEFGRTRASLEACMLRIAELEVLLAKTVAPEPDEPTDDQAKLVKSLEEELATIEQTIKLVEDEKVVVMKGRRRKTRELTALIKRHIEVADKLAKAKAPQVDAAA